jgi:hypothetical protein
MVAGGQPRASRFTPMGRSTLPVQLNRRLSEPLILSGYLRRRKFSCPFWDDSRTLDVKCYVFRTCKGMFLSVRPSVCLLAAHLSESLHVWTPAPLNGFWKTLGFKFTIVAATKFKTRLQFETSVTIYRKRQCDVPEEMNLQQHCCENFKSCSHPLVCRRFCTRINASLFR